MKLDKIRREIKCLISEYAQEKFIHSAFKPGKTLVPPSGKVIGESELQLMVEASLDGWLTVGRFNSLFEKHLASFIGTKYLNYCEFWFFG